MGASEFSDGDGESQDEDDMPDPETVPESAGGGEDNAESSADSTAGPSSRKRSRKGKERAETTRTSKSSAASQPVEEPSDGKVVFQNGVPVTRLPRKEGRVEVAALMEASPLEFRDPILVEDVLLGHVKPCRVIDPLGGVGGAGGVSKRLRAVLNESAHTHGEVRPVDVFTWFLPDRVVEHAVKATREHVDRHNAGNARPVDHIPAAEIRAWVGITIRMGLTRLGADDWFKIMKDPTAAIAMTPSRWWELKRFIKFTAPDDESNDALAKVKPFLGAFKEQCEAGYNPRREVSIDEMMLLFKGRHSGTTVMRNKPIPRGFKIWALCDAHTGYLYAFQEYLENVNLVEPVARSGALLGNYSETVSVVVHLCRTLREPYHHVDADNYFVSENAAIALAEQRMPHYITGTTKVNVIPKETRERIKVSEKTGTQSAKAKKDFAGTYRWISKEVPELASPDAKARLSDGLTIGGFFDSSPVYTTSSCLRADIFTRRVVKVARTKDVKRKGPSDAAFERTTVVPAPIHFYNRFMAGVDRHDQRRSYYPSHLKGVRWWHSFFYWYIDAAMANAHIVHSEIMREQNKEPLSAPVFRDMVSLGLIGNFTSNRRRQKRMTKGVASLPEIRHVGVGADHFPRKHEGKPRVCMWCAATMDTRPHRTKFECIQCNVPLCIDCFRPFHK